jgi:signal recognition particle subunit SEC65
MENQSVSIVVVDKTATRKYSNCVKQLNAIEQFNKTNFAQISKDLSIQVKDNATLTEMKEISESIENPKLSVLFDLKRLNTTKTIYRQSLKD